mmetsp:Transcript_30181/g.63573  ORF Transcript_30181/g.63573 Transcript_30181/m.63573 type:complete len:92 (-) Transcript_30181:255-530(-)
MGALIELLLAISGDDGEVFLRGLDEVHGGDVGDGFSFGVEEEVEGHALGAELGDREEGRDDGAAVVVVDEDFPGGRGGSRGGGVVGRGGGG